MNEQEDRDEIEEQKPSLVSRLGGAIAGLTQPADEGENEDELADLVEVPDPENDHDMQTDDLFELDEEESVGDVLAVSREDILYGADKLKPKSRPKVKRLFIPPETHSIKGVR